MLPRPRTPNVEGSQSTLDSRAGRPRRSRRQRRLRRQRATPGQRNQNKTGSKVKPYLQSASSPMFYLFEATKLKICILLCKLPHISVNFYAIIQFEVQLIGNFTFHILQ